MIASGIGPTEIGLILVAVLLLFGGAQQALAPAISPAMTRTIS